MKKQDIGTLTPAQAQYVLNQMAADRKIGRQDINHYLGRMETEISELESRLNALKSIATTAPLPPTTANSAPAKPAKKAKRRAATVTPEVAASRALQGRYISMVKRFPQSDRAKYKKIAQAKGREEAIKKMTSALKK